MTAPVPAKTAAATPSGPTPHLSLMTIVAELIFIAVLVLLSGASPEMETMVTTLLVGLWLAFIVNSGPKLVAAVKIRS